MLQQRSLAQKHLFHQQWLLQNSGILWELIIVQPNVLLFHQADTHRLLPIADDELQSWNHHMKFAVRETVRYNLLEELDCKDHY